MEKSNKPFCSDLIEFLRDFEYIEPDGDEEDKLKGVLPLVAFIAIVGGIVIIVPFIMCLLTGVYK